MKPQADKRKYFCTQCLINIINSHTTSGLEKCMENRIMIIRWNLQFQRQCIVAYSMLMDLAFKPLLWAPGCYCGNSENGKIDLWSHAAQGLFWQMRGGGEKRCPISSLGSWLRPPISAADATPCRVADLCTWLFRALQRRRPLIIPANQRSRSPPLLPCHLRSPCHATAAQFLGSSASSSRFPIVLPREKKRHAARALLTRTRAIFNPSEVTRQGRGAAWRLLSAGRDNLFTSAVFSRRRS